MEVPQIVEMLAGLATAVAVFLAWGQLRLTRQQQITSFEDQLAREYRELAHRIPVKALLNEPLGPEEYASSLPDFYRYIDLTNEQVFLRRMGRVRRETWEDWCDGIRSNFGRPAFAAAWREIKSRVPESFAELRALEAAEFKKDPYEWRAALPAIDLAVARTEAEPAIDLLPSAH